VKRKNNKQLIKEDKLDQEMHQEEKKHHKSSINHTTKTQNPVKCGKEQLFSKSLAKNVQSE
jgi:hypothetical protein